MNDDTPNIPVLTDKVLEPAEPAPADARERIAAELHAFIQDQLQPQMAKAMAELADDLCQQADNQLRALLDKHLGK